MSCAQARQRSWMSATVLLASLAAVGVGCSLRSLDKLERETDKRVPLSLDGGDSGDVTTVDATMDVESGPVLDVADVETEEAPPTGDADACEGGICDAGCGAGLTQCPGAGCVDTMSSPSHCGACDVPCGATCTRGACVGAELIKQLDAPRDIYADRIAVVWSHKETVQRCELPCVSPGDLLPQARTLSGRFVWVLPLGQPRPALYLGLTDGRTNFMGKYTLQASAADNIGPAPLSVAADDTHAFFSSGQGLYSTPFGTVSSTKTMDLGLPAEGLALGSTALFWHHMGAGGGVGGVYGCDRASCNAEVTLVQPFVARSPAALFARGAEVYFADNYGVASPPSGADIWRCPAVAAACTPTLVASREAAINAIAVVDGYVYWSTPGSPTSATGTIRACRASACTPQTLAENLPQPVALFANAPGYLWVAAYGLEGIPYSGGAYRIAKPK